MPAEPDSLRKKLWITAALLVAAGLLMIFANALPRQFQFSPFETTGSGLLAQRFRAIDGGYTPGSLYIEKRRIMGDTRDRDFGPKPFALNFNGFLFISIPGPYQLAIESDDDSMLYIDGALEIDNSGAHPMLRRETRLWLGAGLHVIELKYRQRGGKAGLGIYWKPFWSTWSVLPLSVTHPASVQLSRQTVLVKANAANHFFMFLATCIAWLACLLLLRVWVKPDSANAWGALFSSLVLFCLWHLTGGLSSVTTTGQNGSILVFSSTMFLFAFLPIVLLLYSIMPSKWRNILLLAFSFLFYAWGEPNSFLLLPICAFSNHFFGLYVGRQLPGSKKSRFALAIGLVFNLALLFFFKYANFAVSNLVGILTSLGWEVKMDYVPIQLPIGISFFTFQAMSYLWDVYRGTCKPQKSLIKTSLYISLFPQLIAGPIVRYPQVSADIESRHYRLKNWSEGSRRFILGLAKKVLIANTVGEVADNIFSLPGAELSLGQAWLGAVAYTLQIFYDFSGYSDMAIGLGRIFGFHFPENFNYPYISQSIREFWRRWHITLSTWFRDYVYIPLGGSHGGAVQTYRNLLVVFLLCGIWHGASWNFLIWGLFHGVFLSCERLFLGKWLSGMWRPFRHCYAVLVIIFGWVWFRVEDLGHAIDYFKAMLGMGLAQPLHWVARSWDQDFLVAMLIGIIGCFPVMASVNRLTENWLGAGGSDTVRLASIAFVFSVSLIYVASSTYNPFIYFRF